MIARMITKALAVAAVLVVAAPAAARADAPVSWQQRTAALVEHVFRPACGPVSFSFEDASSSHAGFPAGPAGEPQSGQAVATPTGWARSGDCVIHLDRDHVWLGFPEFCHVGLHEGGNVVGYSDDWANPRSIRYPLPNIIKTTARIDGRTVTSWSGVDRRCLG
jgi:hypothetical protein